MTFHYHVFGMKIGSTIPLPADQIILDEMADVTIDFGVTPDHLENPQFKGVRFQAVEGELLLKVDGIATYHILNGNRITINPVKGVKEDDILLFLMGSAMGALLHQRNILVLHAGAVQVNGGSVLFSGASGAGKSTLTAAFHRKGYPFLADDLCAVSTGCETPSVMAGFPRLKLWADALHKLDEDKSRLKSVRWGGRLEKYFMPVSNGHSEAVPVKDVFVLHSSNSDKLTITQLKGSEKVNALVDNTFRLNFLKGLGGKSSHFQQCVQLGTKVRVFKVIRPSGGFLLSELADAVEEMIHL